MTPVAAIAALKARTRVRCTAGSHQYVYLRGRDLLVQRVDGNFGFVAPVTRDGREESPLSLRRVDRADPLGARPMTLGQLRWRLKNALWRFRAYRVAKRTARQLRSLLKNGQQ